VGRIDAIWPRLDVETVLAAVRGHRPERIRTHWVDLAGVRWPPKQVVALATGLGRRQFDSRRALMALGRLGLPTSAEDAPDLACAPTRTPDVAVLLDPDAAVAPADLLTAGREASKTPGLYTWWADAQGAADLTTGLGHRLSPGFVYAGRAGGARPSGVRSTNTLWGRIATMHLGGRRQFSTLRTTLSACLSPLCGGAVDGPELTAWMHQRLRVAVLPLAAEDVVPGEQLLLELADPSLNLRDVARTDLRRELTRRRSALPAPTLTAPRSEGDRGAVEEVRQATRRAPA
jgi:hypothetical protein